MVELNQFQKAILQEFLDSKAYSLVEKIILELLATSTPSIPPKDTPDFTGVALWNSAYAEGQKEAYKYILAMLDRQAYK